MKNETAYAKKLSALLKRIKKTHSPLADGHPLDPIGQLILSMLEWEAPARSAALAYKRLMNDMVDYNDLRVSHPVHIESVLGPNYPRVKERTERLLGVLNEVYTRQHAVSFEGIAGKPKKEIRAYLDSLPSMPTYVSAQLVLLCFGGHAVPVDQALLDKLVKEGAIDPDATVEQANSILERQIRAADAHEAHLALRAWVDSGKARSTPRAKTVKKRTTKTTKKKTTRPKKKTTKSKKK